MAKSCAKKTNIKPRRRMIIITFGMPYILLVFVKDGKVNTSDPPAETVRCIEQCQATNNLLH